LIIAKIKENKHILKSKVKTKMEHNNEETNEMALNLNLNDMSKHLSKPLLFPSFVTSQPEILKVSKSEEFKESTKCFNQDVNDRLVRFTFIAVLPCIFLVIISNINWDISLPLLIGMAVESMYIVYFSIIAYFIYSANNLSQNRYLFRIWTRSKSVAGWANMSVAIHQQLYYYQAIQSISEFSAIDGGIASYMLSNLGPFTWTIISMHFAAELYYNPLFVWDITDFCEIIGVVGLVMIGIFELDPYNQSMKLLHYIGAVCGVGTIIGFVIQQYSISFAKDGEITLFALLSLFILIMAPIFFVLWQWSNKKTNQYVKRLKEEYGNNEKKRKPSDKELELIRSQITRFSLQNIIFEGIFLFLGASSLAMWLMNYHKSCHLGCAGHVK
jgi:hypothetical protein